MKKFIFIVFILFMFAGMSCEMPVESTGDYDKTRNITPLEESTSEKPSVLLVGDSRVFMWPSQYFTDEWEVFNVGVSGSTSQFAAFMIYNQTRRFDTIIISSGINDYHEGISAGNTVTYLNIAVGWAKLKADNVFLTTIPGMMYNGTSKSYNVSLQAAQANMLLPTVAANQNIELIPLASLLCSGWWLKAMYTIDGIHYNALAYEEIYDLYNEYIRDPLEE